MLCPSMRRIAAAACFFFMTYALGPHYALAEEPVNDNRSIVTLQKDECAPFTGTLFSTLAAAELLVDLETHKEGCEIKKEKALSLLRTELQLQIDLKQAEFDALQYKYDNTLLIKTDQIKFLQAQLRPPAWYESGEFWFAIGAVVGITITAVSAYALGQAAR